MKNVELYVPKVEDLWFRQECLEDAKTMEYNAGYDAQIPGYHYDTGCIDFPKSEWQNWFNRKMKNPDFYFAYIKDTETNQFIGFVNFSLDKETQKASMGINIHSKFQGQGYMRPAMKQLVEIARKKNVKFLTDTVPDTRKGALKVFFEFDFAVKNEYKQSKFNNTENVLEIEKEM